ncbi:MAG: hypothetical protein HGA27_07650 [Peptococcaceae bacterium]|nr:hypothetical protein [Peptococcaceae bacterium]
MRKILLLILILSLTLITGCSSRAEVKQMAIKEQAMIEEVAPMVDEMNKSFSKWKSGEITREQLSTEIALHYPKIHKINQDWDTSKRNLTRFAKNNASLWKISYMSNICYSLENFIANTTQGYPESIAATKGKPLSDKLLIASFQKFIVEDYNYNVIKATKGINEVINFF